MGVIDPILKAISASLDVIDYGSDDGEGIWIVGDRQGKEGEKHKVMT